MRTHIFKQAFKILTVSLDVRGHNWSLICLGMTIYFMLELSTIANITI